jgi:hypothetical protein
MFDAVKLPVERPGFAALPMEVSRRTCDVFHEYW